MERRPLGRTGVTVSRLGLGAMVLGAWGNTDRTECLRIVRRALDAGVDLVDTADVYAHGENEELVGEALVGRRDEVVLATKFHNPMGPGPNRRGNGRRWIAQAVEASLRRLRTDRIDLYQVHRPDPATDLEETVDALSDLVRAGKILYWGTSTVPASDLVEAHHAGSRPGREPPRTEQPPYSILCRGIESEVLGVCARYGMGVLVWSPLAGGWLTGKYTRDDPAPAGSRGATQPDHFDGGNPAKFDAVERLAVVAAAAGIPLTHLSLAWTLEHPAVSCALIGPRTDAQLDDLLGAADLRLDADVLDAIDAIVPPGRTLNPADTGWSPPGLDPRHRRRNP
jgi:aryl-alcohol dehydrogenase-like predicted oxidoreductase